MCLELNSHADTCVVGRHALVVHKLDKEVMAKVIDAATRYTQRDTGDHLILMVQAILVPKIDHCLLCPIQCRMKGMAIHEVPRFLTLNPTT
ncbi:hypothetical protein ACHAW6_014651 [Cyclotella cf. meneghiniana]